MGSVRQTDTALETEGARGWRPAEGQEAQWSVYYRVVRWGWGCEEDPTSQVTRCMTEPTAK